MASSRSGRNTWSITKQIDATIEAMPPDTVLGYSLEYLEAQFIPECFQAFLAWWKYDQSKFDIVPEGDVREWLFTKGLI